MQIICIYFIFDYFERSDHFDVDRTVAELIIWRGSWETENQDSKNRMGQYGHFSKEEDISNITYKLLQ